MAAVNRRPPHLTVREEEILRAIRHSIRDRGEALSVGQPARELGLRRPASAAYHLANLEERGALARDGHNWQTCRLTR
ncbi:LexA family protein [Streptomyces sp. NPDC054950]